MSEDLPPDWAIERAVELMGAFADPRVSSSPGIAYGDMKGAFARYIAEHEEPPVDEIAEALRATFGAAAPEFVAAFKSEIAKRGLVITGADK